MKEKPRAVSRDHYLLKFESGAGQSQPGQFINIRVSNQNDPLLRRPFSIFSHEKEIISIIIRTVGKGTEQLARREPGEIDILGPLGNGFTAARDSKVLIVGGGVGNAPLHYLARKLAETRCETTYIYGARSRAYIYLPDLFRNTVNRLILATDDGTEGEAGLVTDIAAKLFEKEHFDMIYTCGPLAMMKALVALARDMPIEVSVENYFGCGIGLCSGCTIETSGGLKRACIDGPVFNGASIKWETMPD